MAGRRGRADGPAGDPPASGGPRIELPSERAAAGTPIVVAVTYRKLLEVTHFHLFTMPVVLLIVGHLFFATGLSDRAKLWWIVAASLAVVGHLATPWLVRYASPGLAIVHALTGGALTLTMTVLTGWPVWRCGGPDRPRRRRRRDRRAFSRSRRRLKAAGVCDGDAMGADHGDGRRSVATTGR